MSVPTAPAKATAQSTPEREATLVLHRLRLGSPPTVWTRSRGVSRRSSPPSSSRLLGETRQPTAEHSRSQRLRADNNIVEVPFVAHRFRRYLPAPSAVAYLATSVVAATCGDFTVAE